MSWISPGGWPVRWRPMVLADGAAVTRIEPPEGDPFAVQSGYRVWHRGKRSARSTSTPARPIGPLARHSGRHRPGQLFAGHHVRARHGPRAVVGAQPPPHHLLDHRLRRGGARPATVRPSMPWWRLEPACSMTRRAGEAPPWNTSWGGPVPCRSSTVPRGWCAAQIGQDPFSPGRPGRAWGRPTWPRWASPPPCGRGR